MILFGARGRIAAAALGIAACSSGQSTRNERQSRFGALSPDKLPAPPADPTNRFADDPRAAALGKKLFFDPRFSGPLLDDANDGGAGTLGTVGQTGRVACASCHVPAAGFLDPRSPRRQLSLGSSWTRRRAPSLLDIGQSKFLMWDGSQDTAFGQVFAPIEDPLEMNSSRLYAAQVVSRLYKSEYEAIFGPLPPLNATPPLDPAEAGCKELPPIPNTAAHGSCETRGKGDSGATRVVANVGKAIEAFTRRLSCGPSRFDAWVHGDDQALTDDEQAGAALFVGKAGCLACHSGPFFSDQWFHNTGLFPANSFFTAAIDDPGAAVGLRQVLMNPLNSRGPLSDGDDGRLSRVPEQTDRLLGAFRTPSLRCVGRRPSYLHTGQYRSLEDVVLFFNRGGSQHGYPGVSENFPRNLTDTELAQLVAFLRALDGPGPGPEWTAAPNLPPEP